MLIVTVAVQLYAGTYLKTPSAAGDGPSHPKLRIRTRKNLYVAIPSISALGKTVLFTPHSLHEAERSYDQVAGLEQGQIRTVLHRGMAS